MSAMASQIASFTIIYSTLYSRCRSKKTSKLRVTGLCGGNSPVTSEFPAQKASNAKNISIWWRPHVMLCDGLSDATCRAGYDIQISWCSILFYILNFRACTKFCSGLYRRLNCGIVPYIDVCILMITPKYIISVHIGQSPIREYRISTDVRLGQNVKI